MGVTARASLTPWKQRLTRESGGAHGRRTAKGKQANAAHLASRGDSACATVRARALVESERLDARLRTLELIGNEPLRMSHAKALRMIAEAQRWSAGQGDRVSSWEGCVT